MPYQEPQSIQTQVKGEQEKAQTKSVTVMALVASNWNTIERFE
jgi:hypothetical protein